VITLRKPSLPAEELSSGEITVEEALPGTCVECGATLPESRMPLVCGSCGDGIHPSCAGRVERGVGWGNRTLFCARCA
jgi:hypothetical protein